MGIFVLKADKAKMLENINTDARFCNLWADYVARVNTYTQTPTLEKMYDSTKWWHLIWERVGDAAFVYLMNGDERAGAFVHEAVMHTCLNRTPQEWIGPFYRPIEDEPIAKLETSHISCALCVAYDMCPDLFTDEEKRIITSLLRERILPWSRRHLEKDGYLNNWRMVILNGYVVAACVLGDDEAVAYAVDMFNYLVGAYNSDSYGESVQYSNYASLHLTHAYEVLTSFDPALADRLDTSYQANLIKWYAANFMYMKPMSDKAWGDKPYPRTLNIGDSAAIFRPTADVLMHVAKRYKTSRPVDAGLAMWLFETTYKEDLLPYDRSTFGFFNQYHYYTFINYVSTDELKPLSPKEANMPLIQTFETGITTYRTTWDNPKLILGIQGGYKERNISAHVHLDQNSFILAYNNERMLIDPGHCCYRLWISKFSRTAESHNTWTFEKENGEIITQTRITGDIRIGKTAPMNVIKRSEKIDDLFVFQSDCAKAYGDDIIKAQRTWLVLGDDIMIIVDNFKSELPVKPISHYVVNNSGEALTEERVLADNRIVILRNGVSTSFFPLEVNGQKVGMSRNWGALHDCYHPEPNRLGEGKEGSALIYDYKPTDYVTDYTSAHAVLFGKDTDAQKWQITNTSENSYRIERTDKKGGLLLTIESDGILLEDLYKNKKYYIEV